MDNLIKKVKEIKEEVNYSDIKPAKFITLLFSTCYTKNDFRRVIVMVDKLSTMLNDVLTQAVSTNNKLILTENTVTELRSKLDKDEDALTSMTETYNVDVNKLNRELATLRVQLKAAENLNKSKKQVTEANQAILDERNETIIYLNRKIKSIQDKHQKELVRLNTDHSNFILKALNKKDKEIKKLKEALVSKSNNTMTNGRKLNCDMIKELKIRVKNGENVDDLSNEFNISPSSIYRAVKCITYRECCKK